MGEELGAYSQLVSGDKPGKVAVKGVKGTS